MMGGLRVVSPLPNPQARVPPLASCPQLPIQYIYGSKKLTQKHFCKLQTPGPAAVTHSKLPKAASFFAMQHFHSQ